MGVDYVWQAAHAAIQAMLEQDNLEPYVLPTDVPKKTEDELVHIAKTVKANFLFAHLSEQQRRTVFEAMQKFHVRKDEVVIKQGDRGEHFYVIQEGDFDVYVAHESGPPELVSAHTQREPLGEFRFLSVSLDLWQYR